MALKIRTARIQREEENSMAMFTATKKLWFTQDRQRVVEDGHPDAAFLFISEGLQVPQEEAIKFGLVKTEKAAPESADKSVKKPADKSVKKPADKSVKKPADKKA